MCFTFNNHKQGIDEYLNSMDFENGILEQTEVIQREMKKENNDTGQTNSEDGAHDIFKVMKDRAF